MEQTCSLLKALGIRDTGVFEANGVTGGDLLELTPEEMVQSLNLAPLQVRSTDGRREVSSYMQGTETLRKAFAMSEMGKI